MRRISKEEYLDKAPFCDIYQIELSHDYIHVLAYSDEINEQAGFEEPCGLHIPVDTEASGLWEAIESNYESVKLYGELFDENNTDDENYSTFLFEDSAILQMNSEKEALSFLKSFSAFVEENNNWYLTIVVK